MDKKTFQELFQTHRHKISEAWNLLTDKDLNAIDGDLDRFLERVEQLYKVPEEVLLKELEAVQSNIAAGTEADFAPRLDPTE